MNLVIWVNRVAAAGSIRVGQVTGAAAWNENALTWNLQSAFGTAAPITVSAPESQFVTVDITTVFQAWQANSAANFGLVVDSPSGLIYLDSKER